MIKIISQNGDTAYEVKDFVCDTMEDIEKLPKNCGMGSTCLVISESRVFMLNGNKEWSEI